MVRVWLGVSFMVGKGWILGNVQKGAFVTIKRILNVKILDNILRE
jgi:hypothetical protein